MKLGSKVLHLSTSLLTERRFWVGVPLASSFGSQGSAGASPSRRGERYGWVTSLSQGQHKNRPGPSWDSNPEPSCCEVTVPTKTLPLASFDGSEFSSTTKWCLQTHVHLSLSCTCLIHTWLTAPDWCTSEYLIGLSDHPTIPTQNWIIGHKFLIIHLNDGGGGELSCVCYHQGWNTAHTHRNDTWKHLQGLCSRIHIMHRSKKNKGNTKVAHPRCK